MVPLLYVFLKNLFGKTVIALCGSALFAFDFMHLTQTRIATIDTYGVFFILAMFFFLYRYLALPTGAPFRRCALPLFLSGLMFGIGRGQQMDRGLRRRGHGGALLSRSLLEVPGLAPNRERSPPHSLGHSNPSVFHPMLCGRPLIIYVAAYLPMAHAQGARQLA